MALEINNNYAGCLQGYNSVTQTSNNSAEFAREATSTKTDENNANVNVSKYYAYLQENYSCMKNNNVSISGTYLSQCAGDPSKAKELEDVLKSIPQLEKTGYENLAARNKALGGTVTYYQQTWMFDKNGNVQSTVYSVTETGATNAERMQKLMDERLEKQKEKRTEEEEIEEKKEKNEILEEKKIKKKESIVGNLDKDVNIKYVETDSRERVEMLMKKDKVEDNYHIIDMTV